MSLEENIKKRRLALKMSQQELADALGYKTRSSIAKIERNASSLTRERLYTLANTLQTSVSALMGESMNESDGRLGTIVAKTDLPAQTDIDKRKCIGVVLAGGNNRINRYGIPYQFVTVKDKPIIIYTMEALQRHPQVDEIHVVCLKGWEDWLRAYVEQHGITKLKEIIPSGRTGMESVKNAVEWLSPSHSAMDLLLLQEATRPFIDPETISNAIRICRQFGNAVVFERMDGLTPFLLGENGSTLTHLPATRLINVQSPEVYTFGILRQALVEAHAIRHSLEETICAVFLHYMGRELHFCEGNPQNRRIINEEDLKYLNVLAEI